MKVKDLIELNAMITDLEITVRKGGNLLLDQLNIGPSEGVIPPYPTRVPKKEEYANSLNQHTDKYKDAAYIPKSINSWWITCMPSTEKALKQISCMKRTELRAYGWK